MSEKHVTGRDALTKEQQERMDAVRNLLRMSKEPASKVHLADVDRFERQAGMTSAEKVQDTINDDTPYKDARMQQHFSNIRGIRALRGGILVEVDEDAALRETKVAAFRVLGPLAEDKDILNYVKDHQLKTTLFSIPKFIKNLKLLMSLVQIAPENFGLNSGGGQIKDIIEEAIGAIKDARAYLKAHREKLPDALYNMLKGGELQLTDKHKFVEYLGEGWESDLRNKQKAAILSAGQ